MEDEKDEEKIAFELVDNLNNVVLNFNKFSVMGIITMDKNTGRIQLQKEYNVEKPMIIDKDCREYFTKKTKEENSLERNLFIQLFGWFNYVGERDKSWKPHGFGMMKFPNGEIYAGQFLEGERYGSGSYNYLDNSIYVGEWVMDMRMGVGVMRDENGGEYEGQWWYDMRHGWGKQIFSNGDVYEGSFDKNKLSGGNCLYYFKRFPNVFILVTFVLGSIQVQSSKIFEKKDFFKKRWKYLLSLEDYDAKKQIEEFKPEDYD